MYHLNSPFFKIPESHVISLSQKEPNLIKFGLEQFRKLFSGSIRFTFQLGEDSTYFMDGEGLELLKKYYGGQLPKTPSLNQIRSHLDEADKRYLAEKRPNQISVEDDLAFYYFHKSAMQVILTEVKQNDLKRVMIALSPQDRVTSSLRRPFKKGARKLGGSSRSDEVHVGNVTGLGELFLKMLYEIEDSILRDSQNSSQGLIQWDDTPSLIGKVVNIQDFFTSNPYGVIGEHRPKMWLDDTSMLKGQWRRGQEIVLQREIRIDPLWCYTSGLYLAEGRTNKSVLFSMFKKTSSNLSLQFTSSENNSLELMLRVLHRLFLPEDCLTFWKVKVGSQYFPELVVIGLKNAVPMLRGGESGDGKLRTMEISLAVKKWALEVAPILNSYADKYSHVEPTGAGVPRIDFSASSTLCKWYFPLLMYAVFSNTVSNPRDEFRA